MKKFTNIFFISNILSFWGMVSLLVISFILYIFFVNATIVNIVDRKQTQAEARNVAAHISELESEFYAMRSDITVEYATSLGFTESADNLFAVRDSNLGLAQLSE